MQRPGPRHQHLQSENPSCRPSAKPRPRGAGQRLCSLSFSPRPREFLLTAVTNGAGLYRTIPIKSLNKAILKATVLTNDFSEAKRCKSRSQDKLSRAKRSARTQTTKLFNDLKSKQSFLDTEDVDNCGHLSYQNDFCAGKIYEFLSPDRRSRSKKDPNESRPN